MSTVVNKPAPTGDPTFEDFYVQLVANTPDFPPAEWVRNSPNLAALIGAGTPTNPDVPKRYWIVDPINSQNLREMTAPEKAVVDTDVPALAAAKATQIALVENDNQAYLLTRYTQFLQTAFQQLEPSATGQQMVALNGWFAWVESVYQGTGAAEVLINAAADIPAVQAITVDYPTLFDGSDPLLTLIDATV